MIEVRDPRSRTRQDGRGSRLPRLARSSQLAGDFFHNSERGALRSSSPRRESLDTPRGVDCLVPPGRSLQGEVDIVRLRNGSILPIGGVYPK